MSRPGDATQVLARAKVNLSLHVTARRADGYHLLDGLVVFPEIGDLLSFETAEEDALVLAGPMAPALGGADNLVLRALRAARSAAARRGVAVPALRVRLDKHLPVAAGLGGGSADAAAVLAWLSERHRGLGDDWPAIALSLGADVPMCLAGVPAHVGGIGDVVTPLAAMPELHLVLVNCGEAVSTPSVFARRGPDPVPAPPVPMGGFATVAALLEHLRAARNDLQPAACAIAPGIGSTLAALHETGPLLTRMSGSGATVFALYEDAETARRAAASLSARQPRWWVAAAQSRSVHPTREAA